MEFMGSPQKMSSLQWKRLANELSQGEQLLAILQEKRQALEQESAISVESAHRFQLTKELEETKKRIAAVEKQLYKLKSNIKKLELYKANADIEEEAAPVIVTGESSINFASNQSVDLFTPDWSVVRSEVRYVDANLAYRFADATQDANIMLGFTTLFLGSAIGFGASLVTAEKAEQKSIFGTSLAFTTILTIIFFVLTLKFMKKLAEIKRELFDEIDEKKA
jgi:hypothetical protein